MKDYTPFQKQLGRFLATRRMQKHLTQQEMAEKLYLDRSAISKMERGDYKMLLFRIMDYCREIDVHLSEVIKEFESPPPQVKIPNGSRLSSILAKNKMVITK